MCLELSAVRRRYRRWWRRWQRTLSITCILFYLVGSFQIWVPSKRFHTDDEKRNVVTSPAVSCTPPASLGVPPSVRSADGCRSGACDVITCEKLFAGDARAIKAARNFTARRPQQNLSDDEVSELAANCSELRNRGGYILEPVRPTDAEFPVAFTILVHHQSQQFERLLRAIYRPQNIYCVHADTKSPESFLSAITAVVKCFDNVFLASQPQHVVYAGFSRLQADIECMKDHVAHPVKWRYLLNTAGQSYPLRTPEEMVDILRVYNGANDIEGIYGKRRLTLRYRKEWIENRTTGVKQTGSLNPPPPHDLDIIRGSAYGVFSRKFVEFVLTDQHAKDLLEWSRRTYSPDEHYWATLHHTYSNPHLHTPGGYSRKPDSKSFMAVFVKWSVNKAKCQGRWVRWVCVLGVGDITDLVPRREFFVNKFDMDFEPLAFECTEAWLRRRVYCPSVLDLDFYRRLDFVVPHS